MKIVIDPAGVDYTLIAGGSESPEDQEVNAQELLQIAEGLRATSAQAYNRGNFTRTHSFQITRTYASIGAAERALFEHPGQIPKEGDIKIIFEPCTGADPYVTLTNATVHAYAARQSGVAIRWRYTITSGAGTITTPP